MTEQVQQTETETVVETTTKKRGRPAVAATTSQVETKEEKAVESSMGSVEPKELELKVYKLNEHTTIPSYGTKASACFDIRVNFLGEYEAGVTHLSAYTKQNQPINRKLEKDTDGRLYVELRPYERLIAPTGAIFDIPEGYSLKAHPRSGTSLKQGINLINQEAVIDSDYVEELKLLLVNDSESYVKIYHGERYAQGELQEVIQNKFVEIKERPKQKTDRTGGLGHTGKA